MSAIYILIGCSIPIALGFLVVFLLAARKGQFDDDYTPSIRMLMEDEVTGNHDTAQTTKNKN